MQISSPGFFSVGPKTKTIIIEGDHIAQHTNVMEILHIINKYRCVFISAFYFKLQLKFLNERKFSEGQDVFALHAGVPGKNPWHRKAP